MINFPLSLNFSSACLISLMVLIPAGISTGSSKIPLMLGSLRALSMLSRISLSPGLVLKPVKFIVENGLLGVRSAIE